MRPSRGALPPGASLCCFSPSSAQPRGPWAGRAPLGALKDESFVRACRADCREPEMAAGTVKWQPECQTGAVDLMLEGVPVGPCTHESSVSPHCMEACEWRPFVYPVCSFHWRLAVGESAQGAATFQLAGDIGCQRQQRGTRLVSRWGCFVACRLLWLTPFESMGVWGVGHRAGQEPRPHPRLRVVFFSGLAGHMVSISWRFPPAVFASPPGLVPRLCCWCLSSGLPTFRPFGRAPPGGV